MKSVMKVLLGLFETNAVYSLILSKIRCNISQHCKSYVFTQTAAGQGLKNNSYFCSFFLLLFDLKAGLLESSHENA